MSDVVVASGDNGKQIVSYDVMFIGDNQFRLGKENYCGFMNKLKARIMFLSPEGIVIQAFCTEKPEEESCLQCKRNVRKYTARSATIVLQGERFVVKDINKTYITLKPCGGKMLKHQAQ